MRYCQINLDELKEASSGAKGDKLKSLQERREDIINQESARYAKKIQGIIDIIEKYPEDDKKCTCKHYDIPRLQFDWMRDRCRVDLHINKDLKDMSKKEYACYTYNILGSRDPFMGAMFGSEDFLDELGIARCCEKQKKINLGSLLNVEEQEKFREHLRNVKKDRSLLWLTLDLPSSTSRKVEVDYVGRTILKSYICDAKFRNFFREVEGYIDKYTWSAIETLLGKVSLQEDHAKAVDELEQKWKDSESALNEDEKKAERVELDAFFITECILLDKLFGTSIIATFCNSLYPAVRDFSSKEDLEMVGSLIEAIMRFPGNRTCRTWMELIGDSLTELSCHGANHVRRRIKFYEEYLNKNMEDWIEIYRRILHEYAVEYRENDNCVNEILSRKAEVIANEKTKNPVCVRGDEFVHWECDQKKLSIFPCGEFPEYLKNVYLDLELPQENMTRMVIHKIINGSIKHIR